MASVGREELTISAPMNAAVKSMITADDRLCIAIARDYSVYGGIINVIIASIGHY